MSNIIYLPSGPLSLQEGDAKDVSDGHHSFQELYNHRVLLFIALMVSHPSLSWRAKLHEDGSSFEGSFIAGIDFPQGTITYHIPNEFWHLLEFKNIKTSEFAPPWDGHTSFDVIDRLTDFIYSK